MDIDTHAHLDELRRQLRQRLAELRGELAASRGSWPLEAGSPEQGDFKDLAERQFLMQLNEVHARHEFSELQAVQAALMRLEAGAYGDCSECGEPIGLARLRHVPTATRCLDCQQRFEHDLTLLPGGAAVLGRSADYA